MTAPEKVFAPARTSGPLPDLVSEEGAPLSAMTALTVRALVPLFITARSPPAVGVAIMPSPCETPSVRFALPVSIETAETCNVFPAVSTVASVAVVCASELTTVVRWLSVIGPFVPSLLIRTLLTALLTMTSPLAAMPTSDETYTPCVLL